MSDIGEILCGADVLTPELRETIITTFSDRGKKALHAIDEGRVIRYRDFFVVRGSAGEYIVDEDFCTCGDFLYRKRECSHILAVKIALVTGSFVHDDRWYQDLMRENSTKRDRKTG